MIRASGERWVLVGKHVSPRESGSPINDWVASCQMPDGKITRLVPIPLKTPDGKAELFPKVAYNEPRKVLICMYEQDHDDGPSYDDVWRYDLATGQSRWIAKKRWDTTRGFAWSPDGSKVAFLASSLGPPVAVTEYDEQDDPYGLKLMSLHRNDKNRLYVGHRDHPVVRYDVRTVVVQYDLDTDELEEVADDACRFGDFLRQRRPAYSEDGNWIYYISMDQHVMRVDLRTKVREQLPFKNGIAVLAIKGDHLIYTREVTKDDAYRFQIVKVNLNAPDDSHSRIVDTITGMLNWNFVSPSRRFVLFTARYGYGVYSGLLDVEGGARCGAWGLVPDDFRPHNAVFVGPDGPEQSAPEVLPRAGL